MPWRDDAVRLLEGVAALRDVRDRLSTAASMCQGVPYRENPLGGGPGHRERVRLALTTFDCVTFVESMVALSVSRTPSGYRSCVIKLRYGGREPSWEHRLHYWARWFTANEESGLLAVLHPAERMPSQTRTLASVPGVPAVSVTLRFHPWSPDIASADIVGFGSDHADLDVFHVGILAKGRLWHASRTARRVVDEPLAAFLSRERGSGLLLARVRDDP